MRKAAILASICVGMSVSGARAVDISLKSSFIQTFEGNSNYQMQSHPPGETYLPVSTVVFDALARTPTMRFAATVDLSYRSYFGPGAELLLPALDRGVRGSIEKFDQEATYKIEASRREVQSLQLQLAETGFSTVGGTTITNVVEVGTKRQVSYLDLATLSVRATAVEFNGANVPPSLDLTTTGTWSHRVNQLTDVTPMVQFESITYGTPANSPSSGNNTNFMIWRGTLGVNSQLTKRLNFSGAAGVVDVTLNQSGGGTLPSGSLQTASGSAADWIANMQASYKINSRDTFSLAAAQTVGPDSLGVLRKFDVVGAVLSHRINRYAGLAFSTDYSHQPSPAGVTDLYSSAITYDYQWARDWYSAISYRFRQRIGLGGEVNSHSIFLSVRRDVTIIPSATGQAAPPTPDVTALLSWPAAWIQPWRNSAWWH